MTGFIEPNAINLLHFQCKPIRGYAGGKITTWGDRDRELSLFSSTRQHLRIYQTVCDLVNVDNCHRSGCAKTVVFSLLLSLKLESYLHLCHVL